MPNPSTQAAEGDVRAVVGLGPIGLAVLDELVNRGIPARGVSRRRPPDLPRAAQFVEGDITDAQSARAALAGATVVYHTASAPYHRWPELLPPVMRGVIHAASAAGARSVSGATDAQRASADTH